MGNNKKYEEDYDESGMELYYQPMVYIPRFIEDLMYDIDDAKQVLQECEFSILVKAKIENGFRITLTNEYWIAKQEVHRSEVDYKEVRPSDEYNCIIHKHPDKLNEFSLGDDKTINKNFDISLLWTNKESFVKAQYNLYQNRSRCAIDCDFMIVRPPIKKIKGLDKITKYVFKAPSYEIIMPKNQIQAETSYNHHLPQRSLFDDSLNGSMILDNKGNLVEYNAIENAETFEAQDRLETDYRSIWMKYFIENYTEIGDDVTDMAVALVKMLDDAQVGYTDCHDAECNEYFSWMGIASYALIIQQYKDDAVKVFGRACANEWVQGKTFEVEERVRTVLRLVFKDVAKKLEGGLNDSGDSKTGVASTTTH